MANNPVPGGRLRIDPDNLLIVAVIDNEKMLQGYMVCPIRPALGFDGINRKILAIQDQIADRYIG